MTTTYIAFTMIGLCFIIFLYSSKIQSFLKIRKSKNAKPTMFDVRRLLVEGNEEAAIKVYMNIFKVGRKDAKIAVIELKRHIPKNHNIK